MANQERAEFLSFFIKSLLLLHMFQFIYNSVGDLEHL